MQVKDFSVSGEEFQLIKNKEFGYLETTPQPSLKKLSKYYESEDYISHTNSKRNLFEKAYHFIRDISLKRKLKLISSFNSEEKKILDIGCGTGSFLKIAKNNNWNVVGIEPNEKARSIAIENCGNSIFDTNKIEELKDGSFDVITLWHVLEHLPNLDRQIASLKRLLKANGTLIIAVPNFKSFDAKYYKEFWAAYDVPRHLWHFSKESIIKLFSTKKMIVVKSLPMVFDAYYVSLLSEKYRNTFLRIIPAFFIGLVSNLKAKQSGEYSSLIYVIKNNKN
ncbi:methyltransferase family protein [Lacinutrix venerupis]|uniref:class I SAM-dependent methyltransferase n=1 Tax=Lacinutrix venerupis TaxID=1486034 RepID=UPI000EB4C816|nr:class I SAM-dependent methyltransferase [Lacinutrix venerupis]RLJ63331.1 methyltransferase family protein [Lacinutrix venerupis]